jgi:hypothetical protein
MVRLQKKILALTESLPSAYPGREFFDPFSCIATGNRRTVPHGGFAAIQDNKPVRMTRLGGSENPKLYSL